MNNYFEELKNPFLINIEEKDEYTIDDYVKIQNELEKIDIDYFIESLYPRGDFQMTMPFEKIKDRCKRGLLLKIVDKYNNILPEKKIYKLGNGGNGKNCFVCYTSLFIDRYEASQTMLKSLEEVNFNGHFILLNGGFPNPSGKELKYIGVPYCFKIFMMLEAKKLGFENVIWLDAACYAVNNPERLFEILNEDEVIFRDFPPNCFQPNACNNMVFPKTIELMNSLVNRDIRNDNNINTIVFGLKLTSEKIKKFIDEYYEMVKLGLPFLSSFPEEMVFSSIFNKPEFKYVFNGGGIRNMLYIHEWYNNKEQAKNNGYYFVQRQY